LGGRHAFTAIFFASEQAKKDFRSIVAAIHVLLKTISFITFLVSPYFYAKKGTRFKLLLPTFATLFCKHNSCGKKVFLIINQKKIER